MTESIYLGLKPSDLENSFRLCLMFPIGIDFPSMICTISDTMNFTLRHSSDQCRNLKFACVIFHFLYWSLSIKHTTLYIKVHEDYAQGPSSDLKMVHSHREERYRTITTAPNVGFKIRFLFQQNR